MEQLILLEKIKAEIERRKKINLTEMGRSQNRLLWEGAAYEDYDLACWVDARLREGQKIGEKWAELIDFARQHATGQGLRTGIKWLEDSFNEYLTLADETPGYGMGGQPGSRFNREVLAGRIVLELGPFVGGEHALDEEQLARLKESLKVIVDGEERHRGIRR